MSVRALIEEITVINPVWSWCGLGVVKQLIPGSSMLQSIFQGWLSDFNLSTVSQPPSLSVNTFLKIWFVGLFLAIRKRKLQNDVWHGLLSRAMSWYAHPLVTSQECTCGLTVVPTSFTFYSLGLQTLDPKTHYKGLQADLRVQLQGEPLMLSLMFVTTASVIWHNKSFNVSSVRGRNTVLCSSISSGAWCKFPILEVSSFSYVNQM